MKINPDHQKKEEDLRNSDVPEKLFLFLYDNASGTKKRVRWVTTMSSCYAYQVLRCERYTANAIPGSVSHSGRASPWVVWGVVLCIVV